MSHVIRRRLDMLREIGGFKVRRLDIHDLRVKGFPTVYATCEMDEWKVWEVVKLWFSGFYRSFYAWSAIAMVNSCRYV